VASAQPTLGPLLSRGRTAEVFHYGDARVLKLFLPEYGEDYAAAEVRIGQLLWQAGAPVPKLYDRIAIDGRHGIVYQRIIGESMLACLQRQPWRLPALARLLARIHAKMHQLAIPALTSQSDRLSEQVSAAPGLAETARRRLLVRLASLQNGAQALCHGDFHPDNVLLSEHGPIVIDWPTATSGEPAADFARSRLLLAIGQPESRQSPLDRLVTAAGRRLFRGQYLKHYCKLSGLNESLLSAWEPITAAARLSEGIGHEAAVLHRKIAAALADE
jgi:aminoglycoside phosphotransferase (APT) family kinase protein